MDEQDKSSASDSVEQASRRRVPVPDKTTAAFDRAHQVLHDVAERRQAEQAAAAHAAELEAEDVQLRAELAHQAAVGAAADEDTDDDGEVFGRAV